ncbi:tetratricopeptide repeat protein [Commensalibacter papalotli (ex Servin-Garciduenas et al. 2014)]|uniref:Beta-lactamase n=1 Tax=Commensalibacter papalotli (ex Servin-Garciduenas et al. 2014) TaxID=1208583 RepID=W7DSH3_9PROT|nr:SEL1-like repeat protein [Commensalibacter papalotli (ex Servin-Garciduenas et al. 2014)]EUK17870.1 hypothetical protein COMX_07745 [Commensalibacter papalotli (ex Servin-Garciduenas et al. 2014)]
MQFKYKLMIVCTILSYFLPNASAIEHSPEKKIEYAKIPNNNPDILNILANKYINQGSIPLAIPLLNKAAEQENSDSLITLMTLYAHGQGVPQDEKKAQDYFKKFKKNNRPSKLFDYIIFLIQNTKTINNYKKAQILLDQYHTLLDLQEKACYQYTEKMSKEKNINIICDAWIEDEPLYKTISSLSGIIAIHLHHSQSEIQQGVKELEIYNKYYLELTSHLSKGFPSVFLAQLYINGTYVPRDYHKARNILENSLKYLLRSQSAETQHLLGTMYQQGLGVKKNNKIAKNYLEDACSLNNEQACQVLKTLSTQKHIK